ncbi:pro-adrenomedullin [Toxotes jaculatrix]|uniref:pro-adrenomedullin n=1 Tax=Toxotes jaculatrix TaxID=941984 RepID=UPI001B3B195D|nr:pro-adrenomedullin [Toxotes jaculatrix]
MRLYLHTVICCCVFTTVLPLVKGATGELNSSLKKRFKVLLQSRMKRDLGNSLVTANEQYSDIHIGQQRKVAKTVSPPLSFGLNIRPRRSTSPKQVGCVLVTCVYHDLLDRIIKINSPKESCAPKHKIGSNGYGRRRRRSLQDVTQLALQTEGRSTEAGQRAPKQKSTCKVA